MVSGIASVGQLLAGSVRRPMGIPSYERTARARYVGRRANNASRGVGADGARGSAMQSVSRADNRAKRIVSRDAVP